MSNEYDTLFLAIGDAVTIKSLGHLSISVQKFKDRLDSKGLCIAPVPPAGGELEVAAYRYDGDIAYASIQRLSSVGDKETPLVDSAHVTRIQVQIEEYRVDNEALRSEASEKDYALKEIRSQRDALKADVERLTALCIEKDDRMSAMNKSWAGCISERDALKAEVESLRDNSNWLITTNEQVVDLNIALQSELTEARELNDELTHRAANVVDCLHGVELPGAGVMRLRKLRNVLEAHQSAPGAKVDLVECDACPTSGGCVNTCMKATAEKCKTCDGTGIEYDGAGHTCTACNGDDSPYKDTGRHLGGVVI